MGTASRFSAPRCLGLAGDEVIHCILDLMYAKAPYTVMQRAMHIHPTVSEFIPTMLGDLRAVAMTELKRCRVQPVLRSHEDNVLMSAVVNSNARYALRLHPLAVRVMHWINAAAMITMIMSGWKIYNDDIIFSWLRFPDANTLGTWAQHGLQWHFFGMWIVVLNGLAYLIYGIVTGRFRRKLFPVSWHELIATVGDAMTLRLKHDDLTHYNAVQKLLYIGIILVGILIVLSGLAIWRPASPLRTQRWSNAT